MARGKAYDDETRAAVLAALLAGQSVGGVARDYHLSPKTVREWRAAAGVTSPPVPPQKRTDIGDLVAGYLTETLLTLSVQQRHFRDLAWLGKQSAADLAVLHGVSVDKAVRLLAALDHGDEPARAGEGSDVPL